MSNCEFKLTDVFIIVLALLSMLENHVSETIKIIVLGGNFIIKGKQPLRLLIS